MIRFRIGQGWRRERTAPVDGFALELDGVNLLASAAEEPLSRVVPELVEAVHALFTARRQVAQLSLPEAHLELVFNREAELVELSIVSLARPARLIRAPLRLELRALAPAAARCARGLLADLDAAGSEALSPSARRRCVQRLERLEEGELAEREQPPTGGWALEQFARTPGSFGFRLIDPADRLLAFDRTGEAPLASLLVEGFASLQLAPQVHWNVQTSPFLFALELSRQAGELQHAHELGDARFDFRPGGAGLELGVDLQGQTVQLPGGAPLPLAPQTLVHGMVALALGMAGAAASRNKAQAQNPYLQELTARAREALAHLQPSREGSSGRATAARPQRASAEKEPLTRQGRVKRLRFEPRWEKTPLTTDGDPGEISLQLLAGGPLLLTAEEAIAFSGKGEPLYRRVAERGVAVAPDGAALLSRNDRLLFHEAGPGDARWLRLHAAPAVGRSIWRRDGLLLVISENRSLVVLSELTGRELWRAVPPRTHRVHPLLQGHRVLLATDAGYLYGLELSDGQVRYRIRAPLPFRGEPVSWGRRMLAVLGRAGQNALFAADAHSGEIAWESELSVTRPSAPLIFGSRAWIAGEREGDGVLLCFGQGGRALWERALHLGPGPYTLRRSGRSILVAGPSGAASLVAPDGHVEWHLGATGDPVSCAILPAQSRGVLLIPGETVRAVDPKGGQVLAEVKAGVGLCDLRADSKLNLYLLNDNGALRAYRLSTQLAVIG